MERNKYHGRKEKNYTEEFKKQIVSLKQNGKSTADTSREYQIAKSTIMKWTNDYTKSGSFKAVDNHSDEEVVMIMRLPNQAIR